MGRKIKRIVLRVRKRKSRAWKVIATNGRMSVDQPAGRYAVHYIKDKWVRPTLKGSRLFVFATFGEAENCNIHIWGKRGEIVSCEVLDARPELRIGSSFNGDTWKKWWACKEKVGPHAVNGCLTCTAVKCLE